MKDEQEKDSLGADAAAVDSARSAEAADAASHAVYGAVHEELMKLRVKLHSVLNGRSDIDHIVYHAQNRACDAAVTALQVTKWNSQSWQPIETAPKRGEVLLWDPSWCYGPVVGEYHSSFGGMWVVSAYSLDNGQIKLEPTHWLPLPDGPEVGTGNQAANGTSGSLRSAAQE